MPEPLAMSISDAVRLAGVGRSKLYQEISTGRLRAVKVGNRTVIRAADLAAWLDSLPDFRPGSQAKAA